MDIDFIINKIFHVYAWSGVLIICYLLPKFYIKHQRKDEIKPAAKLEKTSFCIVSILLLSFVCWLYADNFKNTLPEFIATFFIAIFPVAFGISHGFKRDGKLTLEERRKIKKEIEDLNETA